MASSIAEMNQIILVVRWWVAIFRHIIYGPGPLQNAFPVTASFSSSRASLSPLGTLWFLSYYATTTGRGGCWGCWGWVDCRLRFSHCDQIFRGETLIRHDRRQNPTFRSLSSYHIIFRLLNPKRFPTRKIPSTYLCTVLWYLNLYFLFPQKCSFLISKRSKIDQIFHSSI